MEDRDKYVIGKTYDVMMNGQKRFFTVIQGEQANTNEYFIRWDDGDKEWAYVKDMDRWVRDSEND